ncbi:phosphocholine-specific phospholipase C [Dechloromonas denitrificans]|uniref:phosphocholine-specific phospholipase C n=1 Tax=Dechloromonas denitrificans TaxID=281362 RepID=UPI001CFA0F3C|nr:phospholipase C, phosphocholine-specific [Dechloromonas denitrificans]UCV07576.1 phospholipase C, phosphocholine-specific [Dechloromonas denitrificans]
MTDINRRNFLRNVAATTGAAGALSMLPPSIQRALAIEANRRTGTIQDVEHIVILMQENRSFDHYFGTLAGVRGFGDPFPIPVANSTDIVGKNVWTQPNQSARVTAKPIAPFHLNTTQNFDTMRVAGTPHSWTDAQYAWNNGQMNAWPKAKQNHSLGHFKQSDMPFQFALANAFTLCDAYHCSFHGGTNTNRLFQWTGTNDPLALGNGPATYNDYDWFDSDPGQIGGYTWTTYTERLEDAGISWQVYENMADNFTDNPLAGFKTFRDAWFQRPGYSQALRERGISTRDLDKLKEDVLADKLPQISWIVATAEGSEHPGPSSPAQGAEYTAQVLDALTANPEVWSKTVLFINFDENDGFFDHVPPPAAPSYLSWDADPAKAVLAGDSTVDTRGEYHEHLVSYHNNANELALLHRPYGLGPRVPMYVVSPWSKGGWVNSQVFDHTSVLRFIETRFAVEEPNISPWRRAVCGDLLSAFNFADPSDAEFFKKLPETTALAARARAIAKQPTPVPPTQAVMPVQEVGIRPARALPYELHVHGRIVPNTQAIGATKVELEFVNSGEATAVFHVYDRLNLTAVPRRYTVEPGKELVGTWVPAAAGTYDLWVLGPNGFHRHFTGNAKRVAAAAQPNPEVRADYNPATGELAITLSNAGSMPCTFVLVANKYYAKNLTQVVPAKGEYRIELPLSDSAYWYDFSVRVKGQADYSRRLAGHLETGAPSFSDPALGGTAIADQYKV